MSTEDNEPYLEFKNLYKALKKSCSGVRWKTSTTAYEMNGLRNTARLIKDVKNNTYKISDYHTFKITEPKERMIVATRIRDRQLQRSMCDTELYDAITKSFIFDNASCQYGKGTEFAVERLKKHLQYFVKRNGPHNGYFLKCDISKFFDSTSHDVAKAAIAKRVHNDNLRSRVNDIIDSFEGDAGIGLGSQVSQLIELSVLDDMDHMIKEQLRIEHYIRYMDDFILLHESKEYLEFCLAQISKYLKDHKLTLNKKTQIHSLRHNLIFLNWHYKVTDSGKVLLLPDRKKVYAKRRKIRRLIALYKEGKISEDIVWQSYNGMISHLQKGNSYKAICLLRKEMESLYSEYNQTNPNLLI